MYRVYIAASTQAENIGVVQYGSEQNRMMDLSDKVKYWLETQKKFVVFRNQPGWTLAQTVNNCNNLACEIFVDNHTNAPDSEGTETYYRYCSENGKKLAQVLYDYIAPLSPGKDRGVKKDTWLFSSGLYVLKNTDPPAALIEHIYHTNVKEVQHFLANMDAYAKAEAKAICEYFGETWVEPVQESPATPETISIMFDGKNLTDNMDVKPFEVNGRIMVSVRAIAEAFGYTVSYNEPKTVHISKKQ